ncbi:Endonuclease/exonuclease/phosphatase family protein [Hibiscus syriacus]|uniref:Endonuclease/exonuclease/phosphatase family protein n=1 Tax=Hibiscus syriacus TaxID=106335 RepID=A0A6A2Y4G9_HIBSY|nr:RING-H2 finger protein ATL39-like [Hibiscus syriacus]KAE8675735.1 Endonuclease/exonuclease/phosphatase family protein [Hibiscus syriacus]
MHRHLLGEQISPHNDQYEQIIVDRIAFTITISVVSLGLIGFLLYKYFQRSNESSDENPTEPRQSINSELKQIPVLVYEESTALSTRSSCFDTNLEDQNCAICLEGYVHGDRVRVLPRCKHMFHKKCTEEWLEVPSLNCPICRDQVLEHCLRSARSNSCRNQRHNIGNPNSVIGFI